MNIVGKQAEIRLTQTIDAVKNNPGVKRCLWINLSALPDTSSPLLKTLVAEIGRIITNEESLLFPLYTKELAIVGNALKDEQRQKICDLVSRLLNYELDENNITLYELNKDWGVVAVKAETVLKNKRKIALQQKQKIEAQKRDEILNINFPEDVLAKIQTIRDSRHAVEVMVVEDDPFSRQMVSNSLRKHYNVHSVGTGKDAILTYTLKAPDVLLLDIELPDITGHQVLDKVLKMDPNAYIIMLSGNGDKENILRAMKAGAKGFVAKPFTKEKLLQYIERCAAHQKQPA